jgi:prepilin-type N-terminal cleavage/methylation domain-containing protein
LNTTRGFTLIEVLIASGVLACGLVAVAATFSFAIRTNATNREVAIATTLLSQKMEEFRAAPFTEPIWLSTSGSETITVGGIQFVRQWIIGSTVPRSVTVAVEVQVSALTRRRIELIRATTLVSPSF